MRIFGSKCGISFLFKGLFVTSCVCNYAVAVAAENSTTTEGGTESPYLLVSPETGEIPGKETTKGAEAAVPHEKKITYKVAAVEFHRVEFPIVIGVWIFCASLAKIGFNMVPINQKVPESCLLITIGLIIGLISLPIRSINLTALTPDTFFLYMLPPIILDAGYFMPNRLFFDNIGTILMFAVAGTLFNVFAIGSALWIVKSLGFFGRDIPILELFLFASLISAVDPVAVLAVFEEIHVNEILYIVVFGESLLNDAVTVVLYHMFEAYNEIGPENVTWADIFAGIASFFVVAVGGTFIGGIWGLSTGFVTKFTRDVRVVEPVLIFVMAYLAYLNAEIFRMSGILAITFCGITMKNYVEANISHKSHTTIKYAMKMLSSSSETIIFMFLGVSTISEDHEWNVAFVFFTIVFCTLFRAIGVIMLTSVVNHFRLCKLNKVDEFVMSYGGLRGAVAFALALLIDPKHVKNRSMFVTTTIAVIYFTVFFQGITIRPLVKVLNVKRAEKRKPTMNERLHGRLMDHLMAGIENILGHRGNHNLRDKFRRFDNNFVRPYLVRNHQGAEPKILETFSKLAMRDAMDFMTRNASTLGNISHAESVSAIFRNYGTVGNLHASSSGSQLDNSFNIDVQELEYNPSKKDITDAKVHHLLTVQLEDTVKPERRRRFSYSRHEVDDKDTSRVIFRTKVVTRQVPSKGEEKCRHRSQRGRRSQKERRSTKVKFPSVICPSDTIEENKAVENEDDNVFNDITEQENDSEDGITFTVRRTPSFGPPCLSHPLNFMDDFKSGHFFGKEMDFKKVTTPTAAEVSLPWRRTGEEDGKNVCSPVAMTTLWTRDVDENVDLELGRKTRPGKRTFVRASTGSAKFSFSNLFRNRESEISLESPSPPPECESGMPFLRPRHPYNLHINPDTPILRRSSMMELTSRMDQYSLQANLDETRFRSGSMYLAGSKFGFFPSSKSSSTSSSSPSPNDTVFSTNWEQEKI